MTANPTKTQGSMSDDNENSPEDSLKSKSVTKKVTHPSTIEPEKITETDSQQESASNFKLGKTLLGLGENALLIGNILVLTNHLKPSSSMTGMEGMDRGNMSHDEMMAVDGSFNSNPVRVETVKPQVLEASVSYTGTIKPYEEIMVYPRVAGQLTNYSVYPGDRVTAGQPIATLDASELTTSVAEAAAEVSTMETDLEMSKIEVDE